MKHPIKQNPVEKKRSKFLKFFIIIILLVIILGGGALLLLGWYNDAIYTPSNDSGEVEYLVEEGDTLTNIADELETNGVLKNKDALRVYLRLNNLSPTIKAGAYLLKKNLTIPELIEIFEGGVFKPSIWITVQEGLRNEDIGELLNSSFSDAGDKKNFKLQEFLNIVNNPDETTFSEEVAAFLSKAKPEGKPLTGYLFPDTYRMNSDATALEVIETMILNLEKRLTDNQIEASGIFWDSSTLRNFYEALILASILEREAGRNDDISMVSGVFYNRLKINFPLEADSTVNYITGKNDAGVLISDTKIDSPYNTYKYPGLPPTPINNPGIRSIKGAIEPKETDYFFFWHSSSGQIYFAVTFDQHQRNIQQYP